MFIQWFCPASWRDIPENLQPNNDSLLGVSFQTNLRRFADLPMVSFLVCTLEALRQLSLMTP